MARRVRIVTVKFMFPLSFKVCKMAQVSCLE